MSTKCNSSNLVEESASAYLSNQTKIHPRMTVFQTHKNTDVSEIFNFRLLATTNSVCHRLPKVCCRKHPGSPTFFDKPKIVFELT